MGGPDVCGYAWTDSRAPSPEVGFEWVDLLPTGTRITAWNGSGDDGFAGPFPLGFSFAFYDNAYTEVFVGTNGYLSFAPGPSEIPGSNPIPSSNGPNNFIMPYGADLYPGGATAPAGVYYQALSSPNRFAVEYFGIPVLAGQDPVTFEVILNETGEIWFQYRNMTSQARLIGIENAPGTAGIPYSRNVTGNLAIRFASPISSPASVAVDVAPCVTSVRTVPGGSVDAALTVTNIGRAGDDTFDMTFDSAPGWSATAVFYHSDGTTPLSDHNGNGVPDTDALAPGATADILVRVSVPSGSTGLFAFNVAAASTSDAGVSDTSRVQVQVVRAIFRPPHSDVGVDSNGNGKFDFLNLDVNFTVAIEGYIYITGYLHHPANGWTLARDAYGYYGPGNWTTTLSFEGFRINASDADGPYFVNLQMYDPYVGGTLDIGLHRTAAYSHLEFDTPPAAYRPPHSDFGNDTDGDGLFDRLVLDANLSVDVGQLYSLFAELCGWSGNASNFCLYDYQYTYLEPGQRTVRFSFDGRRINASGVDGPYRAVLSAYEYYSGRALDQETHPTAAYSHLDFDTPAAVFHPPHSDRGQDLDGDLLWDFLNVEAVIEVDVAQTYALQGTLCGGSSNSSFCVSGSNASFLDRGIHSMRISFDGAPINASRQNGPYHVSLWLAEANSGMFWDNDTYQTAAYGYAEFNGPGPAARFRPPHLDIGRDTDGDGDYNQLVIEARVAVRRSGSYYLSGALYNAGRTFFLQAQNFTGLETGIRSVWLTFDGQLINASDIDGPYRIDLMLYTYDYWWGYQFLGNDTHTTGAYRHGDFDGPPAYFSPPHSNRGLDTDGDRRYNVLAIDAVVASEYNGTFYVSAQLRAGIGGNQTGNLTLQVYNYTGLSRGRNVVLFRFDGALINASGADGPYWVSLWLADAYSGRFLDNDTFRTAAYAHTDFEELPTIRSVLSTTAPRIDGAFSPNEWNNAAVIDLSSVPGNALAARLYVKDDARFLYVAYDATGDTYADYYDVASIAFDTGNDGKASEGREDVFVQGTRNAIDQSHWVWSSCCGWVVRTSPYNSTQTGLASAAGFGTSPNSAAPHRIYEFAIPYALLGVQPGEVIGFLGASPLAPGVYDSATGRYAAWPWSYPVQLSLYGDLVLSPDTLEPTLAITGPATGALFSSGRVDVTWSASDVGLGLDRIAVSVDDRAPTVLSADATAFTFNGLSDGTHAIRVVAYDRAGNVKSQTVSVVVDTIAPNLSILSPQNRAALSASDLTASWTASDATSGLVRILVSLDGETPNEIGPGQTSYALLSLSEGSHRLALTAVDRAGHSRTTAVTFIVDTVAPSLAIQAPSAGSVSPSRTVTVAWIAFDLGAGLGHLDVSLDGGTAVVLPADAAGQTLTGVADGSHTLRVSAFDRAGNSANRTVTFVVDTALFSPSGAYGPIPLLAVGIAVVGVGVGVFLWQRNRRSRSPPPPPP